MSDEDKPDIDRRRNRSKRRAPVIELTAQESAPNVSEPAAASSASETSQDSAGTPPTSESKAELPPVIETKAESVRPEPDVPVTEPLAMPPPPPQQRSLALPLAVAGIVGALFGGIGGLVSPILLGTGGGSDATKLAALERNASQLSKDQAALASMAELEKTRQALSKLDADLVKRLQDTASGINQKVSGLEDEIKSFASRPAPVAPATLPAAPAAPPVDLSPLQQRIAALEAQIKALDAKAESAAKAADPRIAALSEKIDQATKRSEAGSAAPLFAAVQALAQAFHRGAPFANELSAVELLGGKATQLQPLRAFADKGAPTPQRLAEGFAPLATQLASSGEASGFSAFLQRFVKLRPAGEASGNSPQALVATIEAALARGDLPLAMASWGRLPEPARALSAAWAAGASDRDRAAKALLEVQDAATAALRNSKS